jgi:hypothetical protein
MSEWTDALKAGDRVIVASGYYGESLATVDRVTATQVVVGNSKYRKCNGYLVGGDSWSRHRIDEATPERVAKIRRATLAAKLAGTKWHELSLAELEKVVNLVKECKATEATP